MLMSWIRTISMYRWSKQVMQKFLHYGYNAMIIAMVMIVRASFDCASKYYTLLKMDSNAIHTI